MNEIILLQQIEDTVSLYANCVKKGYRTLHYLMEQGEVHTLQVTRPEIIIHNLLPGDYYMYAENEKGDRPSFLYGIRIKKRNGISEYPDLCWITGRNQLLLTDVRRLYYTHVPFI